MLCSVNLCYRLIAMTSVSVLLCARLRQDITPPTEAISQC